LQTRHPQVIVVVVALVMPTKPVHSEQLVVVEALEQEVDDAEVVVEMSVAHTESYDSAEEVAVTAAAAAAAVVAAAAVAVDD